MNELKVVVADDSMVIREHLRRALLKLGEGVLAGMASDGQEAVNMVRALGPDVVVLDISMPRLNGIDVLREIRKENGSTVIVMFTADPSLVLREFCLGAGANFFLDKSQIEELLDICRQLLAD